MGHSINIERKTILVYVMADQVAVANTTGREAK